MNTTTHAGAAKIKTAHAETEGRKIAYRVIGTGEPIIWCNRFRGTMDDWDPAFIDRLAKKHSVIIFDYSGVGLSTGELPTDISQVANDVKDLAAVLQLEKFIIGGWSYGGLVAQIFSTHYPKMITHTILIGTKPPGQNEYPTEQLFIDTASHLHNDFEDEVILFFEPASELSRQSARLSHERIAERVTDKDIPVPEATWKRYFQGGIDYTVDNFNAREKLMQLEKPVLVISGDHDLVFPVENWYALTRTMPNLYLVVLPQSGHGPQHQYPKLCAKYIIDFIKSSQH
ncbi:MAG: alpha/beta hydrolase [Rhizobacter sp.]|nr:alpha/beta hydrolase [Ferruginibacter sp.]